MNYYVRDSFRKLYKQFMQYGYWKIRVIQKHPKQASFRHIMPASLVIGLVLLALLAPFSGHALSLLGILLGTYMSALVLSALLVVVKSREARYLPGIIAALACMHFGYGLGFVVGLFGMLVGPFSTDRYFERLTR